MKRFLSKLSNDLYYFDDNNEKTYGAHKGISGNTNNIYGDASGISGNVSGIYGNVSGIYGNIDGCEITPEERIKGIDIEDLVV